MAGSKCKGQPLDPEYVQAMPWMLLALLDGPNFLTGDDSVSAELKDL